MKKSIALVLITVAPFAFAGSTVLAQTLQLQGYSDIVMADHSFRTSKLIGTSVIDDHGHKLGTIVDVMVKDKATEPMVILSVGDETAEHAKMVAAPLSHIKVERTGVMMPGVTRQVLVSMPAYKFQGLAGGGG